MGIMGVAADTTEPVHSVPPGVYGEVRRFEANGCLAVTLAKAGARRQP